MAAGGVQASRPKILFALDLDQTHFFQETEECIGGKDVWIKLYTELCEYGDIQEVDLVFSIITSKTLFDSICDSAMRAFRPFLERHHPGMFATFNNQKWLLTYQNHQFIYEAISEIKQKPVALDPTRHISHFVICPYTSDKSPHILNIARYHGIRPEHCILLDDTPLVIENARQAGIQTISFEGFHLESETYLINADDPAYIASYLEKKHAEVREVATRVIDSVARASQDKQCDLLDFDSILAPCTPYIPGFIRSTSLEPPTPSSLELDESNPFCVRFNN